MARLVIFGTGQYFKRHEQIFQDDEIVAFLDNNNDLQGKHLGEIPVFPPENIRTLEYDAICLMAGSKFARQMREQLVSLGVSEAVIYDNDRTYFANMDNTRLTLLGRKCMMENEVVVFLSGLINSGGFRAALYAIDCLLRNFNGVTVVSPCDGLARNEIEEMGADVIIASDISHGNMMLWSCIKSARVFFFNALYFGYLMDRMPLQAKKFFWWIHSGDSFYDTYPLPKEGNVCKEVHVGGVSRLVCDAYKRHNPAGSIDLIPFGIPDNAVQKKYKKTNGKVVFAIIGGILKIKGIDIFIAAIKNLAEEDRRKAEFWIIGPEVNRIYADEMHKLSEGLGEIKWLGSLSHDEVIKKFAEIDVLISASREDMLPIVTIEALMNRTTCIVSDAIGTADFLEDGMNGIVFPSGDSNVLKEKIQICIEDRDFSAKIGQNGRQVYEEHFSIPVFEKNLLRILR